MTEDRMSIEAAPQTANSGGKPDRITRWLLIAIGIYSGLLVSLHRATGSRCKAATLVALSAGRRSAVPFRGPCGAGHRRFCGIREAIDNLDFAIQDHSPWPAAEGFRQACQGQQPVNG
jgi:hypothetical protein